MEKTATIYGQRHHDRVHPQVADGEDGHHIWTAAPSILYRQSWTADKVWSSSLGVGRAANKPSPYKQHSTNCSKSLILEKIVWNDISYVKLI